jgi:ATP-binding cassette subfamily B protein
MKLDTDVYFDSYERHKGNPLMTLIGFYKGMYHNFLLSTVFYVINTVPYGYFPL